MFRSQHSERMRASDRLEVAIVGRLDRLDSDIRDVRTDITQVRGAVAALPSRGIVYAVGTFFFAVFAVLLFAVLQLRGVDTAAAARDANAILYPAGVSPSPLGPLEP